jgi:hypothetical protein
MDEPRSGLGKLRSALLVFLNTFGPQVVSSV